MYKEIWKLILRDKLSYSIRYIENIIRYFSYILTINFDWTIECGIEMLLASYDLKQITIHFFIHYFIRKWRLYSCVLPESWRKLFPLLYYLFVCCKLWRQHRLWSWNHIYSFSKKEKWKVIHFANILLQIQDEGRSKVRSSLTPSTAQLALQRVLPYPCKKQYTVVILMPKSSPFKLLKSIFQSTRTNYGREAKVCSVLGLLWGDLCPDYII